MMKARIKDTIMLGLSDMNLQKLKEGQPIVFDGAEIRQPGLRFVIFNKPTEADMEQMLRDHGFVIPG